MAACHLFSKCVPTSSISDVWYDKTRLCMMRLVKKEEVLQALCLKACLTHSNYLIIGEIVCTKSM